MYFSDGFVFEKYDHDYGLSNNQINTFLEDRFGFLWLGTNNGLNVLDGSGVKSFKTYLNQNNQFKGRIIHALFEDSNGNVFCGTRENGMNIFHRKTGEFVNLSEDDFGIPQLGGIHSIIQLSNEQYAFVTRNRFVTFKWDGKGMPAEVKIISLQLKKREFARKIFKHNNQIFIVTNRKLLRIEESTSTTIIKSNWVNSIKVIDGKIWVLLDKKIGHFNQNLNSIEWIPLPFREELKYYVDFEITTNKTLWIGARNKLIRIQLGPKNVVVSKDEADAKIPILGLYKDSRDNLFLASRKFTGFVKLSREQNDYEYINLPSQHKYVYTSSYEVDQRGWYWIAGRKGLFIYDPKKKDFVDLQPDRFFYLSDIGVTSHVQDSDGIIWYGTENGIAKFNFDHKNFDFYGHNQRSSSGQWNSLTRDLVIDSHQNLWYASNFGLNRIDAKTLKHEHFPMPGLAVVFIDEDDRMWLTINKKGLYEYDITGNIPVKKREFRKSDQLTSYRTHDIKKDSEDRLWITSSNGIYIYDWKKEHIVYHINKDNLLENEDLRSITKDLRGNFWVNQHSKPAICIDYKTFEIIDKTPEWMRQLTDKRNYAGPSYISSNGRTFTQGRGGFYVYNQDSLEVNSTPPKVVISELKINGKTHMKNYLGIAKDSFLKLNYQENNVEIQCKVVNNVPTYKTQYAYRLHGSSNNWVYGNSLATLNFSALPSNSYKLQIKATNDGMHWSDVSTMVNFKISPPWWRTNLAYVFYFICLTSMGYYFYRLQIKRQLAESESQKLKEIDEFKNTFYENITHEFRTPLTVISGLTEDKKSKEYKIIKRNADQLLKLVNNLLDLGKIQANSTVLNSEFVDFVSFSRYCLESLESFADKTGIGLHFEPKKNEIVFNFDVEKMQLILNNLFSNAIKFASEQVVVRLDLRNDMIKMEIEDDGPGILEDDIPRIFDRYFQSKDSKNSIGSGIGLAFTKELVMLMNGEISISNIPAKGACFTLCFPCEIQKEEVINKGEVIKRRENESQNVVLVIEDNPDVLAYIHDILNENYEVITAVNGKIGLEKAIQFIPDVIISDVMMPEMNGYEVCERLKSDFRTDHIPVIMLTAKADIESKLSGLRRGADVYLSKPFHRKELNAHMRNLLEIREKLKQKYSQIIQIEGETSKESKNEFLERLEQLLLDHISDDSFGIPKICELIGVSRAQLHRKIKALTNLSTSIFIREIRLKEAYKLLVTQDITVAEAAYSVGFSDPNYFSLLFSERYQKPPSAIKK